MIPSPGSRHRRENTKEAGRGAEERLATPIYAPVALCLRAQNFTTASAESRHGDMATPYAPLMTPDRRTETNRWEKIDRLLSAPGVL